MTPRYPTFLLREAKARVAAIYARPGSTLPSSTPARTYDRAPLASYRRQHAPDSGCSRVCAAERDGSRTHRVCHSTARRQDRGRLPHVTSDCPGGSGCPRNGPPAMLDAHSTTASCVRIGIKRTSGRRPDNLLFTQAQASDMRARLSAPFSVLLSVLALSSRASTTPEPLSSRA